MAKRKTKRYPGSIYVPKGRKQLRVKVKNPDYQPGNPSSQRYKIIATGLPDTPQGWKYAEELLEQFWLQRKGLLAPTEGQKAKYTFEQVWDEFEKLRGQKLLSSTILIYKYCFQNIVTDKNKPCTKANLIRFIHEYISSNEVQPVTFNNNLRIVKTIAKWAHRNGYLDEKLNDEQIAEYYLRVEEKENKFFTEEECNKLFKHFWESSNIADKEFALLLKMMWMTGARISDVLTLTWKQVNIETKEIEWKNKITKKPESVPVSNAVLEVLAQVREITPEREKVFRWRIDIDSGLREKIRGAMTKLEIEPDGRCFHSFRKTFCNNVFKIPNVPLPTSLTLVRHKTVDVTIKHYLAKDTSLLHDAVNRLPF